MEKIWKPLIYRGMDLSESFLVSNCGDIYSKKSNKILKHWINKKGYCVLCVSLGSRSKKLLIRVHVAVAENFIGENKEGMFVNHKDGNKQNNNVENLEWVTCRENVLHAYENGLIKKVKKVKCIQTGQIFRSTENAAMWCGLSKSSVRNFLNNPKRNYAGKHPVTGEKLTWEYVN